jgi:hypothetical protein
MSLLTTGSTVPQFLSLMLDTIAVILSLFLSSIIRTGVFLKTSLSPLRLLSPSSLLVIPELKIQVRSERITINMCIRIERKRKYQWHVVTWPATSVDTTCYSSEH